MNKELILEVKKKREFSGLPDSIVDRALVMNNLDVKSSREFLRKYFGVFLTNKVLKPKELEAEQILSKHKSSANRNYEKVYENIFGEEKYHFVIDLGCGVNGFSYPFLEEVLGKFHYLGIEASGQLVDLMNKYFNKNNFNAVAFCEDLLNLNKILNLIKKQNGKKVVLMFNVVDALEKFERDYSKRLIHEIFNLGIEKIIISNPIESLSGKKKFSVKRKWLEDFLSENFRIDKKFVEGFEEFLIVRKK